jgi:RNA polymerase sigma-70 factor (ECF subfamily)
MDAEARSPPQRADEYAQLLVATATGDRTAFRALHDRVAPILFRVCVRLARDRALAEEALQEAMVRIWQKSHLFDPAKGTALGWMVAVTRNCMFNMIDQRDHVPLDDELVQTLEQPAVPDVGIASDISRCLAKLSEKYRECIVLVYHFGLSYEELASRMSVPVNTVKTWIHRSVEQLRLCLNDETR